MPKGPTERKYANGISYVFETMDDGWIGIYQVQEDLSLRPLIQACDEEKAMDWIVMREPVPCAVQQLVGR